MGPRARCWRAWRPAGGICGRRLDRGGPDRQEADCASSDEHAGWDDFDRYCGSGRQRDYESPLDPVDRANDRDHAVYHLLEPANFVSRL